MAKASATITVSLERDISSVTRYYKLQASTASAPAKPTTLTPSGWTTTEPAYTEGSTNSLYITDRTVFTDGTYSYSDISLSSSYEAAKVAYNKSVAVQSELNESRAWYAVCSTDAAEVAKTATVSPATNDFSLREGMLLLVKFTKTNSGAVANLTLNVNGTGPKSIKYIYNGSLSNIPGANYLKAGQTYQFYYDGANWVVQMIYNTNTNTVGVYGGTVVAGQNGIRGYSLVMKDTDDTWVSITTNAGAGSKDAGNGTNHVKYAGGLHPDAVMYEGTQANYAEGATTGTCYLALALNLRYSTNCGTTLVKNKDVYLVGTIGNDGLFYLDDTWWTQTIPTTEDGKTYIHLGIAYSTYQIYLAAENSIYQFYEGDFRLLSEVKAMKAAKVATKYVTDQTDGIFVHPDGQGPNDTTTPTGWKIRDTLEMLKSGVSYIKAWVENNVSRIRIGREDSAHFLIEDGRICGYGDANAAYFETGDAGNVITQTFIGDGENQYFDLYYASEVQSVTVNGTAVTGYTLRSSGLLLELASVPADGAVVMVKYTTSRQTPYFTFGSRRNSDDGGQTILGIGIGSATMGDGLIAPAPFSYAEGTGGVASGIASHAEGGSTRAKGSYAHSEGWETDAAADYSHAGGYMSEALKQSAFAHGHYVKATAQGGLACGQFNRPDSRYMLCVGNGTSDGSRANALMVTKAGSSIFSGRLLSGASATTGEYRSLFLKDSVYKDNISVGAGGVSGSQTVSAAKSGYTPVGIIGYQISNATSGGTNVAPCFPYTFEIAGDNIKFNIRNTSSSASKLKITFDVLYIATAAL